MQRANHRIMRSYMNLLACVVLSQLLVACSNQIHTSHLPVPDELSLELERQALNFSEITFYKYKWKIPNDVSKIMHRFSPGEIAEFNQEFQVTDVFDNRKLPLYQHIVSATAEDMAFIVIRRGGVAPIANLLMFKRNSPRFCAYHIRWEDDDLKAIFAELHFGEQNGEHRYNFCEWHDVKDK